MQAQNATPAPTPVMPVQPMDAVAVGNPQLPPQYAGFWIRVGARILDALILGIPLFIVTLIFSSIILAVTLSGVNYQTIQQETATNQVKQEGVTASMFTGTLNCSYYTGAKSDCEKVNTGLLLSSVVVALISVVVNALYNLLLPASKMRGTLGKKILGLQIVDGQNNQITMTQSLTRYSFWLGAGVVSLLSALVPLIGIINLPLGILILVSVIWVAADAKKQGLHDKLAMTYVSPLFLITNNFLPLPPRHPSNCLNSQIAVRKFSAPAYVSRVLVS
jgi:uncharacterized RDD family membrane protein YckC